MSRRTHGRQGGVSLVELLVTIVIAGIAFAALVPVFISAHKINQSDSVRTVSRNVASDRLEKIRQLDYDDVEFDTAKLNDPDFANGQFGSTWPNYYDGERVYYVIYDVEPVPEGAETGLEQYKKVTVTVFWKLDDPDNPPVATDSNSIRLSTFIYRQFAGPRINVFNVDPIDDSVDPPWVVAPDVTLTAIIDQADIATTTLVRFSVTALNGAEMARGEVNIGDTSSMDTGAGSGATKDLPGYYDGSLSFEWPWTGADLAPGGTYTFSATGVSRNGYTGNTYEVTYRLEKGLPPAPTGLVATPGFDTIALAWDPSTSGDVDRYAIERSVDGGAWTSFGEDFVGTSYADNDSIAMGKTYRYRVYAIDILDRWSVASAEVSTTPVMNADKTAPPAPPLSGTYTRVGKSVTINWTEVADSPAPGGETQSGMQGYRVFRSTSATFPGDAGQIWDSGGLTATYNDSDTSKSYGITYHYWVVAYDVALNASGPSNVLAVPMGAVVKYDLTVKNASTNKVATVYVFCTDDLQWYTTAGVAQSARPTGVSIAKANATRAWNLPSGQNYVVYYSYPGVAEKNDQSAYLGADTPPITINSN